MLRLLRLLVCACGIILFGAGAFACETNQIDVNGDGTNCVDTKFSVTTSTLRYDLQFKFGMSAQGTFYVDCGNGGTLSGDGVSGKTITRSNTDNAVYICTYSNADSKTIRMAGLATRYSTNEMSPAITFFNINVNHTQHYLYSELVASIDGSLGAMFPTLGSEVYQQPNFEATFRRTSITSIPGNLFNGVTGGMYHMFSLTFDACKNLTTIPENLFSGITGTGFRMFYSTFASCTELKALPKNLFSGITEPEMGMFSETFRNCTGLTGYIPPSMFDGLIQNGSPYNDANGGMMENMFSDTGLDTSCPEGTTQFITKYEDYWNEHVACIPILEVTLDTTNATTLGALSTVYMGYNTGWYSDAAANNTITNIGTLPVKDGLSFDGFYTGENATGTKVIDANGNFLSNKFTFEDVTLYAHFGIPYTVTYNCGNGTGTAPASVTAISGGAFVPADEGNCVKQDYVLDYWAVSGTDDKLYAGNGFAWNYTENKTLTAQWTEKPAFTIITTNLSDYSEFGFDMTARGTFYVDWGDGTVDTIRRSNTDQEWYSHTYETGGVKKIRFRGVATGYYGKSASMPGGGGGGGPKGGSRSSGAKSGNYPTEYTAISFDGQPVAAIEGSLGEAFPTLGDSEDQKPSFAFMFADCYDMTSIPQGLFDGVTSTTYAMFNGTFQNTSITEIPADLFSDIRGAAPYMFSYTFSGTPITEIPTGLFDGISGGAEGMFSYTFYDCQELTALPENLFSGVIYDPSNTFENTFSNCYNLSGYIPASMFAGMIGYEAPYNSWGTFDSTDLLYSCPSGTRQLITNYENNWNNHVACYSAADYTISYVLNGGTNYANAPTAYTTGIGAYIDGIPTKQGYLFAGWCSDSALTDCYGYQAVSPASTGNKTFYARWVSASNYKFAITTMPIEGNGETGGGIGGGGDVVKGGGGLRGGAKGGTKGPGDSSNFSFEISATGRFYVDWGDGTTQVIERDNTEPEIYSHDYSLSGVRTIRLGGLATGYNAQKPAIAFFDFDNNLSSDKIMVVDGSLGVIFPTLGYANALQPRFMGTFSNTYNMRAIPATLFDGVSGAVDGMFADTFANSGISSIPATLFSNINVAAAGLFYETFSSCINLETIPSTLFSSINGSADSMFSYTFANCENLKALPSNLFSNITTSAPHMFTQTFNGCYNMGGYIPVTLFSGLITNGSPYDSDMFYDAFNNTNLATECPRGVTQYITHYEDYWNDRVACNVATSYQISYELNGGTNYANAPTSYLTGMGAIIDGVPTKEGHIFMGWCTDRALQYCDHEMEIDSYMARNVTLYAKWLAESEFKFTITTVDLDEAGTNEVKFAMTATGTFMVDWGDGDIEIIERDNTNEDWYYHYYETGGEKTIRFAGLATGYNTGWYSAITFSYDNDEYWGMCNLIKSIDGDMGAIFPTLGSNDYEQPKFSNTFSGCSGLTSVPANLFNGVTGSTNYMFSNTFYGCNNLQSIPSNLFNGVTGGAEMMFYGTFAGCSGLTSLPENLFGGITNSATKMFQQTFIGCTGLTGYIPPSMFSGLIANSSPYDDTNVGMMYQIFNITGDLATECPTGTTQYITGYEDYWDSHVACYVPTEYTISYELNGGTNYEDAPTTYTTTVGEVIDGVPTKTDYIFAGWCSDSGLTNCSYEAIILPTDSGNKTFYAKWLTDADFKLTLTTTDLSNDDAFFGFSMTAKGTFLVDWGDGEIEVINRNDTEMGDYFHEYESGGVKTVRLGGLATGYAIPDINGNWDDFITVAFENKITAIDGSLGAIFPTLGSAPNQQPAFLYTFANNESLTTIPANLFSGVTGAGTGMFASTFSGTGITEIPEDLFSGITGAADSMFYETFTDTAITTIPDGLFDGVSGAAPYMFASTFDSTNITEIPDGLFDGVYGSAEGMFSDTFSYTLITEIPDGLFSGVDAAAEYMFSNTFNECESLTGYIHPETFAGLIENGSPYEDGMFQNTFNGTDLATTCPEGTIEADTGYQDYWNPYVACAVPPQHTITYELNGGTNYQDAPTSYYETIGEYIDGVPTKANNVFIGWCLDSELTECDTEAWITDSMTTDVTLYAKWLADSEFKFTITTTELPDEESAYAFAISAAGTFYVDWGDGTIEVIERDSIGADVYWHYYETGGEKTIRMGGLATEYEVLNHENEDPWEYPTIAFAPYIASIDGSLGAIFPTLGQGPGQQPAFNNTFAEAENLTTVPATLFSGVTSATEGMFLGTFRDCTGLTSIPADLFSGISGAAHSMFANTFYGCESLTSIPDNLFRGVSGGEPTMFAGTFSNCTELQSLPANLFSGVTDSADNMFNSTFYACENLTGYIPPTMFSGLIANGSPSENEMFSGTFNNTNMATECPTGTLQADTGYETDWNPYVSCYVPAQHTISYVLNGGTNYQDAPESYYTGVGEIIDGTPTKSGYIFGGWCTDSALTDCYTESIIDAYEAQDKTFYAKWLTDTDFKLTLTTTDLSNDDAFFGFSMTAKGIFLVDWGDGEIEVINRNDTELDHYFHEYETGGVKTIRLGGLATEYKTPDINGIWEEYTTIGFANVIAEVNGSLGAIFPTLGQRPNQQPLFFDTFANNEHLTTIPETLFSGVTGAGTGMFAGTFANTGLTSIPANLFSKISGAADGMFMNTFSDCQNLSIIPARLFRGVTGAAQYMFAHTFGACDNLTSVPETLFSGVSGGADGMFSGTFTDCPSLTRVPASLFSGVTTEAPDMFTGTFYNCSNLSGYIPPSTFAGLIANGSPNEYPMFEDAFINTNVDMECPFGTRQFVTGYEEQWEGYVSCTSLQEHSISYVLNGGTNPEKAPTYYLEGIGEVIDVVPTRSGYIFAGWCTDSNLTNCDTWQVITSFDNTDKTFYAKWLKEKFSIVTYDLRDSTPSFYFAMSARGSFVVDWGDGTVETIERDNTGSSVYYHDYSDSLWQSNSNGYKTIRFAGLATGYALPPDAQTLFENPDQASNSTTISFQDQPIAAIRGSLGALFPTLGNAANQKPMFINTFMNIDLVSIPETLFNGVTGANTAMFAGTFYNTAIGAIPANLFSGISGAADGMFYQTFSNCPYLTTIPSGLFSGISGAADGMFMSTFARTFITSIPAGLFSGISGAAEFMFSNTFSNCYNLTSIPSGLFSGVSGAADYMFQNTFYDCYNLASIPAGLFSGVTGAADYMFSYTFYDCYNLTSIPSGLFSGVTGAANYMFYGTFSNCSNLTSIPAGLFNGVTGAAEGMFSYIFDNCSNLTSIPAELFSGVTGAADYMFSNTFASCYNLKSIPAGLFAGVTDVAYGMFRYTFAWCNNLTGYIPPSTFAGLITNGSPYENEMFNYTFGDTNVYSECPIGTQQYITNYEDYWNGRVSCEPVESLSNITYVLNGGTNFANAPTSYQEGVGLTISGVPTKDGYLFAGWCWDEELNDCSMPLQIYDDVSGDIELYAKWTTSCECSGNDGNATCEVVGVSEDNKTCTYVHTCNAGYWNANNGVATASDTMYCDQCSEGSYCPEGATAEISCTTVGDGSYIYSNYGADSENACYRSCKKSDVPHADSVYNSTYYGDNARQCSAGSCEMGYYSTSCDDNNCYNYNFCRPNEIEIIWSDATEQDIATTDASYTVYGGQIRAPHAAKRIPGKKFKGWRFVNPATMPQELQPQPEPTWE